MISAADCGDGAATEGTDVDDEVQECIAKARAQFDGPVVAAVDGARWHFGGDEWR